MDHHVVRVTFNGETYSADALWLSGSPPVSRGWSTQELAIEVLKSMIVIENGFKSETDWGPWPDHYNVEIEDEN